MARTFILLDSCVLAAFFIDRDPNHDEALKLVRYLFKPDIELQIILPPLVIYETGVVVVRSGTDDEVISKRLNKLLGYDRVVIVSLSELAVFKHLRRTERTSRRQKQIRTQDMYILNTAIDFGAPVISFDQSLKNVCQRLNYPALSSYKELIGHQF